MLHLSPCVSWIVLARLREVSEFLVSTTATDRAETREVLEERLHEVEAEVKELRIDSCMELSSTLRKNLHTGFVGSVDHYDIDSCLDLRQHLFH